MDVQRLHASRRPPTAPARRRVRFGAARSAISITLLLAASLGSGCDAFSAPDGRGDAPPSVTLRTPPALATLRLRVPDPDAVGVRLTLDGVDVPLAEAGPDGARVARFSPDALPRDGTSVTLMAIWTYDTGAGAGTTVELARSEPVEVTRESVRDIVLDRYDTSADRDEDGRSNLEELLAGRDPLVAGVGNGLSPASGPDCRSFMPADISRPLVLPPIDTLTDARTDTLSITPNSVDGSSWYAAFTTPTSGNLKITHLAGMPLDTDAQFYRRAPGFELVEPFEPGSVLTLFDTLDLPPDGQRARIPVPPTSTTPLVASIVYCYVLTTRAEDEGDAQGAREPLLDTVVEFMFEPDAG